MPSTRTTCIAAAVVAAVAAGAGLAQQAGPARDTGQGRDGQDAPVYRAGNALVLPEDYRTWPYIGGGLGMTYADEGGTPSAAENPTFSHAFVNPSSYRHFMETGQWKDGTVFMLEFRASATEQSINTGGFFSTHLVVLEAEVKDSRFPDGWAYYAFGRGGRFAEAAAPLSEEAAADCVACHTEHGAVERTFVQFYPTLLDVARAKGTLRPGH